VQGGLVDRQIGFLHALRDAGVSISLAEVLDATRALGVVDLLDREGLRAAYAATVVKRPAHRPAFDTLFDLWFPPVVGEPAGSAPDDAQGAGEPGEGEGRPDTEALRDALRALLLQGDEEAMRRFAREAVRDLGRADTAPGRQAWFSYRVLRGLSPETLMASLLETMLAGQSRGGMAEKVARQTLTERIRAFQEMVESEVRRRLAEDRGPEALSRTAVQPLAEQVDFLRASRDDLAELRRQVFPLARRLATRLTAKRRLGRSGRLDFRRTVRASLGTGGVPLGHPPQAAQAAQARADGAVRRVRLGRGLRALHAAAGLRAVRAVHEGPGVRVHRHRRRGLPLLRPGRRRRRRPRPHVVRGAAGLVRRAQRLRPLDPRVRRPLPDAVGPRTSLLVLGDARNNYRATEVQVLRSLVQRSRHAYWLNPEPQAYWGSGDSATAAYADVVEMVEVRNAVQLEAFVQRLLPT
jgi:uncharacterized protein with von Willebrand factor type A (vWA) domain